MRLHGSARHLQLAGNFGVVTALQKQFDDLLFARSKPNGLLDHHSLLPPLVQVLRLYSQLACLLIPSIYNATLRRIMM
jgi:hypothetical protein